MKPSHVSLVLSLVLAACNAPESPARSAPRQGEPKGLDGKGLFQLDAKLVREQCLRRVVTSDWLYEDGGLVDRGRGVTLEFDRQGNLIRFAGPGDGGRPVELEYEHDGELLLEQRIFMGLGDAREYSGHVVHRYPDPRTELRELFDAEDQLFRRKRLEKDERGLPVRMEVAEGESGAFQLATEWHHDQDGNLWDMQEPERLTTYSFEGSTLTVQLYTGNRPSTEELQETRQYTFDERGLLLSFRRESPDGSFWDRFDYRLDDAGLPIEKTWSRLAYVLQEPYEVTRYRYERFD